MKVIIMCMSGITTTLLANKLQNYAFSIGKKDIFIASRVDVKNDLNTNADIIVMAPQARNFYEMLMKNTSTPILLLDEETFITGDEEKIYDLICSHAERTDETVENAIPLTMHSCMKIIENALIHTMPILFFGILTFIFEHIFDIEFLHHITDSFLTLFSLYFVFALGYSYGEVMKKEPLFCGMICLTSVLVLSPISGSGYINTLFHFTDGTIPIEYFSIRYFMLLLVPALLSIAVMHILMHRFHIYYVNSFVLHAGYPRVVLMIAIIFSLFLFLRMLINFFL